jgi:hypothetical protein
MDVYRSVDTSMRLEKVAQYYANDEETKTAAIKAKIAVDAEVFELVKRAALKSELARSALKGLAYSAAPLAGVGLVGHSLLSKAKSNAADVAEDVRNKVLQTGLGLAGIGAGMYGLHRLTGGGAKHQKEGADHQAELGELVAKLAAVGKIEDNFDHLDFESLSPDAQKLACEVRVLNRGYGVQLLHEAGKGV